jgi:hypothetical protein
VPVCGCVIGRRCATLAPRRAAAGERAALIQARLVAPLTNTTARRGTPKAFERACNATAVA